MHLWLPMLLASVLAGAGTYGVLALIVFLETGAIVSVTPSVAATALRQSRGGSGARIHRSGQPAARNT